MADTFTPPASVIVRSMGTEGDLLAQCDLSGFADWAEATPDTREKNDEWAGASWADAQRFIRSGDLAGVAASDKYLSDMESITPASRKWRIVPAIAGGAVNVGAHLAGSPMSMRIRQRMIAEGAPLTVFCDIVSSGSIGEKQLQKRGAAVLALVRALSVNRPVTVYAVAGMKDSRADGSAFVMVNIPQPLDLARAAFMLAHPASARQLAYACGPRLHRRDANGSLHWAWRDCDKYRRVGCKLYADAIGADAGDCLFVPPPHNDDAVLDNPSKWLADMMQKYGGALEEAA